VYNRCLLVELVEAMVNAIMAVAMTALELGKSLKTQKKPARPAGAGSNRR
jgi:hypothetical protein